MADPTTAPGAGPEPTSTPPTPTQEPLAQVYNDAGKAWGVSPSLLWAMGTVESGNDLAPITSSAGAQGMQQFEPGTAQAMGMTDPQNPVQSVWASAKYMRQLLDQYKDPTKALMAYNAGGDQTKWNPGYVRSVSAAQQRLLARAQAQASASANGAKPMPTADSSLLPTLTTPPPDMPGDAPAAAVPSGSLLPTMAQPPSTDDPDTAVSVAGTAQPVVPELDRVGAGLALSGVDMGGAALHGVAATADWLRSKLGLSTGIAPAADAMMSRIQQKYTPMAYGASGDDPLGGSARALGDVAGAGLAGVLGEGAVGAGGNALARGLGGVAPKAAQVVGGATRLLSGPLDAGATLPARAANVLGRGFTQGAASATALAGPGGGSIGNTLGGGVAGALVNGGVGLTGKLLSFISAPLTDAARRLGASAPAVMNHVIGDIGSRLAADGYTPQTALAKLRSMGPGATLADLPGTAVKGVAKDLSQTEGPAANVAHGVMASRLSTLHEQAPDIVKDVIGVPPSGHFDIRNLLSDAQAKSNVLFNKAAGPVGNPNFMPTPDIIHNVQETPAAPIINGELQKALDNQFTTEQLHHQMRGGVPPDPNDYQVKVPVMDPETGEPEVDEDGRPQMQVNPQLPMQSLMDLKNRISGFKGSVPADMERMLGLLDKPGVKDGLNDELRLAHPAYAQANDMLSSATTAKDAYERGLNFMKTQPADIQGFLRGTAATPKATQDQKYWHAAGVTAALTDAIQKAPYGGNPVASMIKNPAIGNRISAALGHHMTAQALMSRISNVGELASNARVYLPRAMKPPAETPDFPEHIIPGLMATAAAGGHPVPIMRSVGNYIKAVANHRTPAESTAMATLLFNPDQGEVARQLLAPRAKPNPLGRILANARPYAPVAVPTGVAAAAQRPQPNALAPILQSTPQQGQ